MPQLRDSSTEAHDTGAVDDGSLARIFGIETEYGVSVTGTRRPVDSAQTAMTMFQPVVSRMRSTNTYLANGSRLYLDVGSHPEYATAEALTPRDALAQDAAGELVMRRLALKAQQRLRESTGEPGLTIHVFKNNADSAGHSFGCHENYLVRRFVPLETIEHELVPFLVTRQLFAGAGRLPGHENGAGAGRLPGQGGAGDTMAMHAEAGAADSVGPSAGTDALAGFEISQRADFLDEAVSSATTRVRPMVNTRDEPHADPERYRRLHVIIGDSNRSQTVTWLKLITTHLVLGVIEDACRNGVASPFAHLALADPAEANRAVARDRMFATPLALADGGTMTALDIQRAYLSAARAFLDAHRERLLASLPGDDPDRALDLWASALDAIASGDVSPLAGWVDWVAKERLLEGFARRGQGFERLLQVDMAYHDIANGRVFDALVSRGLMAVPCGPEETSRAVDTPPEGTRATLRGGFVARALRTDAQWSVDWMHLTLRTPDTAEVELLDPFEGRPTPAYERLIALLG